MLHPTQKLEPPANPARFMGAYANEAPGYVKHPAEQAFEGDLVEWLVLHEAMLMDEIIPQLL